MGGFSADRIGWLATGVGVLIASAPLIVFNGGPIWPALLGVVVFQMSMPVTLAADYRVLPASPALAVGLPCLALSIRALLRSSRGESGCTNARAAATIAANLEMDNEVHKAYFVNC